MDHITPSAPPSALRKLYLTAGSHSPAPLDPGTRTQHTHNRAAGVLPVYPYRTVYSLPPQYQGGGNPSLSNPTVPPHSVGIYQRLRWPFLQSPPSFNTTISGRRKLAGCGYGTAQAVIGCSCSWNSGRSSLHSSRQSLTPPTASLPLAIGSPSASLSWRWTGHTWHGPPVNHSLTGRRRRGRLAVGSPW